MSIYERTFMSQPIENYVIPNEPSNHNLDKKRVQKRHRTLRRAREPSRIPIQYELCNVWATRAERLENLFTNVWVRAHHRLQKCIVFFLSLRWLNTVFATYIWMGRYNHSLSLDATIMVSKNCSIIGELKNSVHGVQSHLKFLKM